MKKIFSSAIVATVLLSTLGQAASATAAIPTLGMGQGQISVRLGTVNGQPGNYNTQFLVNGSSTYVFVASGTRQQGDYVLRAINYSTGSEPHSLSLYSGSRPNSIGGTLNPLATFNAGSPPSTTDKAFIPAAGSTDIVACWTVDFYETSQSAVMLTVCSDNPTRRSAGSAITPSSAAPVKYAGPEFSDLSVKPVLNGSSTTLSGRKLDLISSVLIGGKEAKLSEATDKSLKIDLPVGLTAGVYDLVIQTANHGKLTHMNAIRVREALVPASLTIKGASVFTGEEFKELTAFAKTQNPDMNTATCIVNSNSVGKSFMQARTLCDRIIAANPSIKTTKLETRSTVESSAVYARVVFSSEQ